MLVASTVLKNKGCWFPISLLVEFSFQLCFLQYLSNHEPAPIRLYSPQLQKNFLQDLIIPRGRYFRTQMPILYAPCALLAAFQGKLCPDSLLISFEFNLTGFSFSAYSYFLSWSTRILIFWNSESFCSPCLFFCFQSPYIVSRFYIFVFLVYFPSPRLHSEFQRQNVMLLF